MYQYILKFTIRFRNEPEGSRTRHKVYQGISQTFLNDLRMFEMVLIFTKRTK